MKIKLIFAITLGTIFSSSAKDIKVSLSLTDIVETHITMFLKNDNILDSIILKDGRGFFLVPTKEAPFNIIIYSKDKRFRYVLFVEDQDVELKGSFLTPRNIICKGSTTQSDFLEYLSIIEPLRLASEKMDRSRNKKSTDSIKRLITLTEREFTAKHPASKISVDLPYYAFRNKTITAPEAITWLNTMVSFQETIVKSHIKSINQITILKDGDIAPDFQSWDFINNKVFSSKYFAGKIVVLSFWASWCGPCLAKIPAIKEFLSYDGSDKVYFVSVSIDDKKDELQRTIQFYNIKFPVLADFDPNSDLIKKFGVGPIPTTYIINKDGKVKEIDFFSAKSLENQIKIVRNK